MIQKKQSQLRDEIRNQPSTGSPSSRSGSAARVKPAPAAASVGANQPTARSGDGRASPRSADQGAGPGMPRSAVIRTPGAAPPGGNDAAIVALQLREAAEKEQDPVLKEKLWNEYKKYKEP